MVLLSILGPEQEAWVIKSSSQHYSCTHILLLLLFLDRGRPQKDQLYVFVRAAVYSSTLTTDILFDIEYYIKIQHEVNNCIHREPPGNLEFRETRGTSDRR